MRQKSDTTSTQAACSSGLRKDSGLKKNSRQWQSQSVPAKGSGAHCTRETFSTCPGFPFRADCVQDGGRMLMLKVRCKLLPVPPMEKIHMSFLKTLAIVCLSLCSGFILAQDMPEGRLMRFPDIH